MNGLEQTVFTKVAKEIAAIRMQKGFRTPSSLLTHDLRDLMLGKLMLVVTEVAEAAEAVRSADFDNFQEELIDILIRVLDICGTCGIDVGRVLDMKIEINRRRPARHGRETTL